MLATFLLLLYVAISIYLIADLWSRSTSVVTRIVWIVVILIPFLGWVAYAVAFEAPSALHPSQRVGVHPYTHSGKKILDRVHNVDESDRR